MPRTLALLLLFSPPLLAGPSFWGPGAAQDRQAPAADGFVAMFNGKDLTGWDNVNCAPGTFFVKDGMIITTGKPTGYLRTDQQYENFIAEFEWFHAPPNKGQRSATPASSSGAIRSRPWAPATRAASRCRCWSISNWKDKKTGKVTATSQGDLFSIWGAKCKPDRPHPLGWERCLPSEDRCKGEYEWNHYRVEANNGVIKLAVNGKVVSGVSECNPRKGYLALESEGSECRFKNLKIKELPSTQPEAGGDLRRRSRLASRCLPASICRTGRPTTRKRPTGRCPTACSATTASARTRIGPVEREVVRRFRDGLRLAFSGAGERGLYIRGTTKREVALKSDKKGAWHRSILRLKGEQLTLRTNKALVGETRFEKLPGAGPIALVGMDGPVQFRNIFIRELKAGE